MDMGQNVDKIWGTDIGNQHPSFSTKSAGMPDFYRVKLDVIGFGQKPHFWNQETSYINALYLISHGENDQTLKIVKTSRACLS